jgi:hypothetical protein
MGVECSINIVLRAMMALACEPTLLLLGVTAFSMWYESELSAYEEDTSQINDLFWSFGILEVEGVDRG